MCLIQQVVILCDGEREQNEHEVLAGPSDLRVCKAAFTVNDVGADPAECADIREQCGDEVRAAVDGAVEATAEKAPAEEARKENDEGEECGQYEEVLHERQCPEAEEREQGKEDDDVDPNQPIDDGVREHLTLVQKIADDDRQDQVGEEIDQPCIDFIHINSPAFPNQ